MPNFRISSEPRQKKGGTHVLIRKFISLSKRMLKLPLKACLVLPVVVMRIIRPVVIIKIGSLDIGRIGGMWLADPYIMYEE